MTANSGDEIAGKNQKLISSACVAQVTTVSRCMISQKTAAKETKVTMKKKHYNVSPLSGSDILVLDFRSKTIITNTTKYSKVIKDLVSA